ncbi:MAG: isoprenylcysteine carboxylmethyltransferase family protein [Deltaproteobacteria bacterium]|nr:isoprenylcysteine carboxylmethyltransferase family protein [Deltaproteobacteria bacterium]
MVSKTTGICLFTVLSLWSLLFFLKSHNVLFLFKAVFCIVIAITFIIRNNTKKIDKGVLTVAVTFAHLCMPFFIQSTGMQIMPVRWSLLLFILGMLISSLSAIDLWRSFGLLPANRGVIRGGVYCVVRHPIYLGYLLSFFGALSHFFSLTNFLLFSIFIFLTIARILREEALLKEENGYLAYSEKVRFRLIPGIY